MEGSSGRSSPDLVAMLLRAFPVADGVFVRGAQVRTSVMALVALLVQSSLALAASTRAGLGGVRPVPRSTPTMVVGGGRRELLAAAGATSFLLTQHLVPPATAAEVPTVLVAGATGRVGRLVCSELTGRECSVIAGVRNPVKGKDIPCSAVRQMDVTGPVADLTSALKGVGTVVCTLGFVPSSPFKMNEAAHAVDNVGTCNLIDASVAAGVKDFIMVSSILTNGRAWGQEKSPGFVITNAFGQVLDEKLVAEQHLRASGLGYTIVRPAGLRDAASGALFISGEDTLKEGEVSRASVAKVCAQAVFDGKAKNRVVEIVELEDGTPTSPANWFA